MRLVFRRLAVLPLPDRLAGDVVHPRQFGLRERRVSDFLTDQVGSAGLGMNAYAHGLKFMRSVATGRTTAVANRRFACSKNFLRLKLSSDVPVSRCG